MNILQDSIRHPATIGKKTGYHWPLYQNEVCHLRMVLPALVKTHHSVAYHNMLNHSTADDLGVRISAEINAMVSLKLNILMLMLEYITLKFILLAG